jgi:diguanylate cyclase (GGDEF)-like protein
MLELQRDKSFRLRLILICLAVAFSVSTIYVVVSYRLSSDLGIEAELSSLHRQTMLLHAELIEADDDPELRLEELVTLIYFNDHVSTEKLYAEAHGKEFNWSLKRNISESQITSLKKSVALQAIQHQHPSMASGTEILDGKRFLWQVIEGQGYKIMIIEVANSVEEALNMVAKRLSLTSVIVIWLATWLAITLSSWMNKRVQYKNDALTRLATHDPLTGLPNRLYLSNMMQDIIPNTPEEILDAPSKQGCLFIIDLDKFKEVNDTFGHAAGDVLLQKISRKLASKLEENQTLMRIGGDEFLVWAEDMELKEAKLLAQTLIDTCNEPVLIHGLSINTGASIGFSHYPSHAFDAESLMICADIAMYEAKQKHSGWSVFSERNTQCGRQRLQRRADLESGLAEAQIKLYYQPKVELSSGHIIGVEALARWFHPTDGLLTPVHFIDLIEQSGRVQEFGRYVIQSAIQQLASWQAEGLSTPVAINLSPYNLLDPDLLNFTLAQLKAHSVSPNLLEIELIESPSSINIDDISERLNDFKQAGIALAIDDFGTGMSSLSYISNLKVNNIKIDRSFITDFEQDPKKQAVVSAALALIRSFGCNDIAEGIENKNQADMLIKMGCRYGQGYYYAKPMPAEEMQAMLQADAALPL